MKHPLYEQTVDKDLPLTEIAPGHFVAADPCCLTAEDYALMS
jgi:peptide/nickel transport system ATP-binding protein/oligopeptide transport system ATP-binding protein